MPTSRAIIPCCAIFRQPDSRSTIILRVSPRFFQACGAARSTCPTPCLLRLLILPRRKWSNPTFCICAVISAFGLPRSSLNFIINGWPVNGGCTAFPLSRCRSQGQHRRPPGLSQRPPLRRKRNGTADSFSSSTPANAICGPVKTVRGSKKVRTSGRHVRGPAPHSRQSPFPHL